MSHDDLMLWVTHLECDDEKWAHMAPQVARKAAQRVNIQWPKSEVEDFVSY